MTMKLKALATASVLVCAAGSANALLSFPNSSTLGSSSMAFVAMDNNLSISLTVDLGVNFADFLQAGPLTVGAGSISAPGTTAQWNFTTNVFTLNGQTKDIGSTAWTNPVAQFFANGEVQGSGYKWGVVGADLVDGAKSPTNLVQTLNIIFTTGVPQSFANDNYGGLNQNAIANGAGQLQEFYAGSNTVSGNTHAANANGASTAVSSYPFLGYGMANGGLGNFGYDFGGNDFLTNPGDTAGMMWASLGTEASELYSIGQSYGYLQEAANPATWSWDDTTQTLTYAVPVPEPGTYALLAAGLALIGGVVRRRTAAR